jgi:ankyrin repeat protein
MHIAAVRGEYKIIKLLILFNASPFIYTYVNGYSPLDYARESGKKEAFNILQQIFEENTKNKNIENKLYENKVKVRI